MEVRIFREKLHIFKSKLIKKSPSKLSGRLNIRVDPHLLEAMESYIETPHATDKSVPDLVRKALQVYFFYDLFLGNINEKIMPEDNRFTRLENQNTELKELIKNSFQKAFGRSTTQKKEDFSSMEMLINLIAGLENLTLPRERQEAFRNCIKFATTNFKRDFDDQ